jgi:hypothetical protein
MSEIMDIKQFAYSVGYQPGAYVDGAEAAQLRKMYAAYQQEAAKAMAKPQQPLTTTNLPTGHSVAMMGNTMQVLPQRFSEPYVGTDGKYYADDLNTGAQVLMTNSTGAPAVPPKPKQAVAMTPEQMAELGLGGTQAQQPQSRGILGGIVDMITGGAKQAPALPADIAAQVQPSAQPTMATNAAAVPSPAAAAQTAPAPVLKTKEEIKQAYRTGQIDQATAVQMLRGM